VFTRPREVDHIVTQIDKRSALQCVAMSCNVLQSVAVCCSVLQCVAVRCSVLQCVAVRRILSNCVALCRSVSIGPRKDDHIVTQVDTRSVPQCCSAWQCVAVCCSVLDRAHSITSSHRVCECIAVCCSVLQCVAVCCIVSVAVYCSDLQCVTVHYSALQYVYRAART